MNDDVSNAYMALTEFDAETSRLNILKKSGLISGRDKKRLASRTNPRDPRRSILVRNWKKSIFEFHESKLNGNVPIAYIFNDIFLKTQSESVAPTFHFIDATTTMGAEYISEMCTNIAILNFANRKNCGGGVVNGATAQEEDLCRLIPTLYRSMSKLDYPLKPDDVWVTLAEINYNDDYTERRVPLPVTVISAAAPNFNTRMSDGVDYDSWCDEAEELVRTLIYKILHAAINEKCGAVVLGAFGCGVFCGPVDKISRIMREEILKVSNYFDHIVFAIPKFGNNDDLNYNTFHKTFVDLLIKD